MFGTWCDDGRIVFDTWNGGLRVLSGEGGEPRVLTQPTDEWHLDPQPLPGPCRVLFYTHRSEGQAIEAISAEVTFVPQSYVHLEGKEAELMLKLMEALEEQDDVQAVHANFDIPQAVMEKVTAR